MAGKDATKAPPISARAFFVRGVAAPQGSKTPGVRNDGKPFLRDSNSVSLQAWRTAINFVLQGKWEGPPLEGPVKVKLAFGLLRPPSVSKKRRPWPTVKPDIDKLVRAVLDAMTGICFRDDSQVVDLMATKEYDEESGVSIAVYPITEVED